jgi:virginiamycin B lyase
MVLPFLFAVLAFTLLHPPTTVLAVDKPTNFIEEYNVPTPNSAPLAITADQSGRIWFAESNVSKLGMFDPTNRTFKEYRVPGAGDMWGATVDKSGQVWLTQYSGKGSVNPGGTIVPGGHGRLLRFNPASANFTVVDVPTPGSFPFRIITDAQGQVWFTELLGNKLAVYDPALNELQEYNVPSSFAGPADLAFDRQGNLWFTEAYNESVSEFQPATKTFTEHHLSSTDPSRYISSPVGIAIASNGHVWFADHGGSWIVEFNPVSQAVERYATGFPQGLGYAIAIPNGVLIDGQGRIWFCEHGGNAIGYYDPTSRTMVEFPIPTGPISTALWITQTANGDIWFTEWSANKIGVVRTQVPVSISVHVSASQLTIAAGSATTVSILVKSTRNISGNGTLSYSWSSYEPADVQVTFPGNPSITGFADLAGEAQVKMSSKTSPGNYTLSIGADLGTVRVWSIIPTEVTSASPAAGVLNWTSSPLLFVIPVMVALAAAWVSLKKLRRTSSPGTHNKS